ncbi:hypothetical protein P0D69_43355 [Paraburkholderia sediminicola]|uniref:hypothetical protein n=1 Tax=Paraburkholderia TaxID=1822464 RepID=UPI001456163A|nr:hypothetical protein [Paraburkholderia aromaticivorans]
MEQMLRAFVICWLGLFVTGAIADDDPSSLLSGSSSHEWIFQRIVLSMGAGDECAGGETYTFSKNHQVAIRRCTKGHLLTTQRKWSVSTKDGDTLLQIDGDGASPYLLQFKTDAQGRRLMRLRTKPPDQNRPVVDKEFKLNED